MLVGTACSSHFFITSIPLEQAKQAIIAHPNTLSGKDIYS
ncbi:hypothetical protein DSUL_20576 [Desulfovibrionales bacterium]